MQAAINIGGEVLDMYRDFSLEFTRKSSLFAFDNIEVQRTASFDIPATARNNRILQLGNSPAYSGSMLRLKHAAQMVYDSGAINGYLMVISATSTGYKCSFIFGELAKLKSLKEAGDIANYYSPSNVCTFGDGWDSQHDGLYANYPYRNGYDLAPTPTEPTSYYPYDVTYQPSIGVEQLITQLLAQFGLSFISDRDISRWRLVPAKTIVLGADSQVSVSRSHTATDSSIAITQSSTILMNQRVSFLSNNGDIWMEGMFKPVIDCDITFANDFTSTLCLVEVKPIPDESSKYFSGQYINFVGDYYFDELGVAHGTPLAGQTLQLLQYHQYFLASASVFSNDIRFNSDYSISLDVAESDGSPLIGTLCYLKYNLPKVSAINLLKYIAAWSGQMLMVEGNTVRMVEQFSTNSPIELMDIISIEEIKRSFADYSQINHIRFNDTADAKNSNVDIYYEVANECIERERTLIEIPWSRGGRIPAYNAGMPDNVIIRDVQVDEELHVTYDGEIPTIFEHHDDDYGDKIAIVRNKILLKLCLQSTTISVKTRMPLYAYTRIAETDSFLLNGKVYFWTDIQWANDIATLQLVQYK